MKKFEQRDLLSLQMAPIPKRLDIKDRKELRDFPLNILFGTLRAIQNIPYIASSLYEPDFDTFEQQGKEKKMRYYNTRSGLWVIVISKIAAGWQGEKSAEDRTVRLAAAKSWNEFFMQLTLGGLSDGEPHTLEQISIPSSKMQ